MDYLKEMSGMDPQSKPEDAAKLFEEWMELRIQTVRIFCRGYS